MELILTMIEFGHYLYMVFTNGQKGRLRKDLLGQ